MMKISSLTLMLASLPLGMGAAQAALVINAGDIHDSKYTYTLTYADMGGNTFANDVYASDGMFCQDETTWSTGTGRYIAENTWWQTASLTYKFDFSGLSHTISAVTIQDNFCLYTWQGDRSATGTAYYSTDGNTWTPIWSLSSIFDGTVSEVHQFSLATPELPAVFYYKAVIVDTIGAKDNYNRWNALWGSSQDATDAFTVSFTVPEPAMATLLLLIGAATITRRRSFRPLGR